MMPAITHQKFHHHHLRHSLSVKVLIMVILSVCHLMMILSCMFQHQVALILVRRRLNLRTVKEQHQAKPRQTLVQVRRQLHIK